jgi:dephospho-CoA kinase
VKTYGVTGGIGMGKSTVAGILAGRGVAVVDTDDLARLLVRPGEPALAEIRTAFGAAVFDAAGELDRDALAGIVFRDAEARKKLEAILHPRIQQRWQVQLANRRIEGRAHAAVIIPLLFETGAESEFDRVICVACAAVTQQRRLRLRGWTPDQIQQRISAQMPVADKMARAQRVIWNEGDLETLARQCDRILAWGT